MLFLPEDSGRQVQGKLPYVRVMIKKEYRRFLSQTEFGGQPREEKVLLLVSANGLGAHLVVILPFWFHTPCS